MSIGVLVLVAPTSSNSFVHSSLCQHTVRLWTPLPRCKPIRRSGPDYMFLKADIGHYSHKDKTAFCCFVSFSNLGYIRITNPKLYILLLSQGSPAKLACKGSSGLVSCLWRKTRGSLELSSETSYSRRDNEEVIIITLSL